VINVSQTIDCQIETRDSGYLLIITATAYLFGMMFWVNTSQPRPNYVDVAL